MGGAANGGKYPLIFSTEEYIFGYWLEEWANKNLGLEWEKAVYVH